MIVNWVEQYDELITRMNRELHVCTPIFRDIYLHPTVNQIYCVGYTFMDGETYIVSITNKDAVTFPLPQPTSFTFTTDKNIGGYDVILLAYIHNITFTEIKNYHNKYFNYVYSYFEKVVDVNRIIPIMLWSTVLKQYHKQILPIIEQHHTDVNTNTFTSLQSAIETLKEIEHVGLRVDVDLLESHFEKKAIRSVKNNMVYSEYNPYTTTGRPSNRFNGINFAALPKSDGSRSAFTSRFDDGMLIQFDFDAYHLRLLGEYANVSLPTSSLHEYLAKLYYNKQNITEEEYESAKQNTFSILYGANVETNIELLTNIKKVSGNLFKEYQKNEHYILSPLFKRKIYIQDQDVSENKVFNYFVQSLEFERTVGKLKNVIKYLKNKKSKLILYTYDAILLDVCGSEYDVVSKDIKNFLEVDGFPVKTHVGKNYNTLEKI